MAENRIRVPNETISQFAERYRVLSNPKFVNYIMKKVTQEVDEELEFRMKNLPSHPRDTGLLEKSWKVPEEYINNHKGKIWEVYLDNTATVSKQYYLKHGKLLYTSGRRRHKRGNPKILRNIKYMKFVDKKTKFYTKQLRVMKNKINPIFKDTLGFILEQLSTARPELFTAQESLQLRSRGI